MKNLLVLFFIFAFCLNAFSLDDYPQFIPVNNLKSLNKFLSEHPAGDKKSPSKKNVTFTVNPYLWTLAISGTVGVPGTPTSYPQSYEINKSFSDALKALKMAFMIGGKIKYKRVSLYYDIVYANLKNFGAQLPTNSGLISANTTNKEFISDLSLAYSFPMKNKNIMLDAYAGTRIWSIKTEITLLPTNSPSIMLSNSKTWVDPIIGVQANFIVSKKVFSYVRSDFGGFNVNSAYTFMFLGGFGYKFSVNWNSTLGVKYLGVDYNKDSRRVNLNHYGLVLSLGYIY